MLGVFANTLVWGVSRGSLVTKSTARHMASLIRTRYLSLMRSIKDETAFSITGAVLCSSFRPSIHCD